MAKKTNWASLTHEEHVRVLGELSLEQIVETYSLPGSDHDQFRRSLARELRLWVPKNVGKFEQMGSAPTKDVVLGAWRDLERSEALLELIDNSIDVWLQRRSAYPKKTAPELNIYIDLDEDTHQLTYEDNAGGVPVEKLENLVVPGHSDTQPLSHTIGSYKTGGKKAVFRLATAAQITTRYWSPAETSDEAFTVQLDHNWINDPRLYRFPYAPLRDKSKIEKGQTRYVLQLREEPIGGPPWFSDPEKVGKIATEIRRAYTLLTVRNPAIHIHFRNRAKAIESYDLYSFSGTNQSGVDIRPQQVVFGTEMEFEGTKHKVEIELVLGCRTTTGMRDGASWGIDLYGNNRLFVAHDQTLFSDLLPSGNSRSLVRGFVNIRGANVFIPWDTHKRHLNVDRDIINVLTKHPLVREVFENWKKTYLDISRSEVSKVINTPLPQSIDKAKHDLFIPHRTDVPLDLNKKRGVSLPKGIFVPRVKSKGRIKDSISVTIKFAKDEARAVASHFGITGDLGSRTVTSEIAAELKAGILKLAKKSSKR